MSKIQVNISAASTGVNEYSRNSKAHVTVRMMQSPPSSCRSCLECLRYLDMAEYTQERPSMNLQESVQLHKLQMPHQLVKEFISTSCGLTALMVGDIGCIGCKSGCLYSLLRSARVSCKRWLMTSSGLTGLFMTASFTEMPSRYCCKMVRRSAFSDASRARSLSTAALSRNACTPARISHNLWLLSQAVTQGVPGTCICFCVMTWLPTSA